MTKTEVKIFNKLKFNLDLLIKIKQEEFPVYVIEYGMSRDKFVKVVTDIIFFDSLPEANKKDLEWMSEVYRSNTNNSKEKLYQDYIRNMVNWNTYLFIYTRLEEYEICELIKKVIQIEQREALQAIKDLYTFEPNDEDKLKRTEAQMLELVLTHLK